MDFKRIILLRHGESRDNIKKVLSGRSDPDLTPAGNKQAKKASRFIKKRFAPVDIIFTSPLKRAYSTAQSVSKQLKVPIQEEELLIETNFGIFFRTGFERIRSSRSGLNVSSVISVAGSVRRIFSSSSATTRPLRARRCKAETE